MDVSELKKPRNSATAIAYHQLTLRLARQFVSGNNMTAAQPTLAAREVYQLLKDTALGLHGMHRAGSVGEDVGPVALSIDDWQITLLKSHDTLNHCETCTAPDGRTAAADNWQRFGTDPVSLLSNWEHGQLVKMIDALAS